MVVVLEIAQHCFWSFILCFDLYIDVEKLWGGGWVHLYYNVISGPYFTMNFQFDQDHEPTPGPQLHSLNFQTFELEYCYLECCIAIQCSISNKPTFET